MNINTTEVIEAASTKWNFMKMTPGLVGGHCIGVDPFYLTHKAQSVGYHPEIILAGRRLNDGMGSYIAAQLVKAMLKRKIQVNGSNVLVMGLSFKENCPDYRNTKVIDIFCELAEEGCAVDIFDPWLKPEEIIDTHGIHLMEELKEGFYDAVIIAVPHDEFKLMGIEKIRALGKKKSLIFDVKSIFKLDDVDLRL